MFGWFSSPSTKYSQIPDAEPDVVTWTSVDPLLPKKGIIPTPPSKRLRSSINSDDDSRKTWSSVFAMLLITIAISSVFYVAMLRVGVIRDGGSIGFGGKNGVSGVGLTGGSDEPGAVHAPIDTKATPMVNVITGPPPTFRPSIASIVKSMPPSLGPKQVQTFANIQAPRPTLSLHSEGGDQLPVDEERASVSGSTANNNNPPPLPLAPPGPPAETLEEAPEVATAPVEAAAASDASDTVPEVVASEDIVEGEDTADVDAHEGAPVVVETVTAAEAAAAIEPASEATETSETVDTATDATATVVAVPTSEKTKKPSAETKTAAPKAPKAAGPSGPDPSLAPPGPDPAAAPEGGPAPPAPLDGAPPPPLPAAARR